MLHARLIVVAALAMSIHGIAHPFKFQERYREILVCNPGLGCTPTYKGSAQFSFEDANANASALSQIDLDTTVQIDFGDMLYFAAIGQDSKFKPGDTKATLRLYETAEKKRLVGIMKVSWTKGHLKVRLKVITPYIPSPVALSRADEAPYNNHIDSSLSFQKSASPPFLYYAIGYSYPSTHRLKRKTVDGHTFELETIKVKGPADL